MRYDAVIVGAGIGGLSCAARLSASGKRVLVLEAERHVGGTSSVFRRGGYAFPMGPLSFGHPRRVRRFFEELGIAAPGRFKRHHFAVAAPRGDVLISRPLGELRAELERLYPREREGLVRFFAELEEAVGLSRGAARWYHDDRLFSSDGPPRQPVEAGSVTSWPARARELEATPCARRLRLHLREERLIRLLGSLGMSEPEMSMLGLGFMWNVMSEAGIWFPEGGIHLLSERLAASIVERGGSVETSAEVARIIVKRGRAAAVVTVEGRRHEADWVVSNADAKTTFLRLCDPDDLPLDFRRAVESTPYTGSTLRVFLGVDPGRVDLSRLAASHLVFRPSESCPDRDVASAGDFAGREIEACLWSAGAPGLSPPGRCTVVLSTAFDYDRVSRFRSGLKTRRPDYPEYKRRLVRRLVRAASFILPGLEESVELIEAATPLTFEDWGRRWRGSIAGWSWDVEHERAFGRKLLIETPVRGLLQVGIYAAAELFLGGIPTSVYTGSLAARRILGKP